MSAAFCRVDFPDFLVYAIIIIWSAKTYKAVITMEYMNLKIGEKLKILRTTRTLSLDDVSALTGVSKPMLGQIERGQSIPTVTTLWKIATGLKTPLSFFLERPQTEYTVVSPDQTNVILGDNGKCGLILCSPMTRCAVWRPFTLNSTRTAATVPTGTMTA